MLTSLNTSFRNPKTVVCEEDINTLSRFLARKFESKNININIKEVDSHNRITESVTNDSLLALNKIKMNPIDYLGRFSLCNLCTPRGDNRIRDTYRKVYYVMDCSVELDKDSVSIFILVVSSHNVVVFFESLLNRIFKNPNQTMPTHMIRTIRQSLVFAKKEDRGDLDGDIVDMKEESSYQ